MTLASENPVYTKGSINSTTKQPMAIICDALTMLSGNWSDDPAKAANADKTVRAATATTINFSYITGSMATGGGNYNGGLENLPRFLEDWTGKTLTYRDRWSTCGCPKRPAVSGPTPTTIPPTVTGSMTPLWMISPASRPERRRYGLSSGGVGNRPMWGTPWPRWVPHSNPFGSEFLDDQGRRRNPRPWFFFPPNVRISLKDKTLIIIHARPILGHVA